MFVGLKTLWKVKTHLLSGAHNLFVSFPERSYTSFLNIIIANVVYLFCLCLLVEKGYEKTRFFYAFR